MRWLPRQTSVMQSYYKSIKKQQYTVQEVMTLASLVEREGSPKMIGAK